MVTFVAITKNYIDVNNDDNSVDTINGSDINCVEYYVMQGRRL